MTIDIAARITKGTNFADGEAAPLGDVLLVSAEDNPNDTVRPRLDRARADVARVHRIKAVKVTLGDGNTGESFFNLDRDIDALERALDRFPNIKLIVIDPVNAYMGRTDTFVDSAVRAVLAPLCELAAERKIAIIAIMHLRKSEASALLRVSGSVGFVAAARIVWGFGPDPDNPERRVMIGIKNNLGRIASALAFKITSDNPENLDEPPYIDWLPERVTNLTADDVINQFPRYKERRARKQEQAAKWLADLLKDGPVPQKHIEAEAERAGFSWATIRRAADDLGVIRKKASFGGGWMWSLPEDGQEGQGGHTV